LQPVSTVDQRVRNRCNHGCHDRLPDCTSGAAVRYDLATAGTA
jgi:hypothetical protein